jgi:putative cardiolipin synthase
MAVTLSVMCLSGQLLGCATTIPGGDYPRVESVALANPELSTLGAKFAREAQEHSEKSAFRILTMGVDGFLTRVQMIESAEKTLDVQYFIFRGDETGRLITDALVRAADRGVRVRVLVDDGATVPGDEQVLKLDGHAAIQVRVFNPLHYRGTARALRAAELLFGAPRLDYRMHNKLLVADNAVALVGGRNIGNQYFQMDTASQFADDDVFAAGPIARQLSATFDEYWNSAMAVPARALGHTGIEAPLAAAKVARRRELLKPFATNGVDYVGKLASGQPLAGMLSGELTLVWASADVVCDSPDKKAVIGGQVPGRLMAQAVLQQAVEVQSELLMITPYFIPVPEEMSLVTGLPARGVTVRLLTNSLVSAPEISAHSGYRGFRVSLLSSGVQLYELRALPGEARGSGQPRRISRYGNYALHAKLFVFDERRVYLGSMNLDQRSKRLNTEVGVIVDSPDLAQETSGRFEAMVRPANAYAVSLKSGGGLVWDTEVNGMPMHLEREPARSEWQRFKVWLLSLLPLNREL